MHSRIDRINELIGQKVSSILHDDVLDPDQYFSVTHVETSPDLGYCDIEISFLKDGDELIKNIVSNQKQITLSLSRSIELRKTPKLRFHIDKTAENAAKIEKIFKNI